MLYVFGFPHHNSLPCSFFTSHCHIFMKHFFLSFNAHYSTISYCFSVFAFYASDGLFAILLHQRFAYSPFHCTLLLYFYFLSAALFFIFRHFPMNLLTIFVFMLSFASLILFFTKAFCFFCFDYLLNIHYYYYHFFFLFAFH